MQTGARSLLRGFVALGTWVAACSASGCGDDDAHDAPRGRDAASDAAQDGASEALPFAVTPGEALAGVCVIKAASTEHGFARCTGFEQLEACARRQCDLELCIDQCPEYLTCLQVSDVVCDDRCVAEGACLRCMSEVAQCAFSSTCIETFGCAKRVAHGYCDQLRDCCAQQGDQLLRECMVLAEATASIQGEGGCRTLLDSVSALSDASVACAVTDAGTPKP